MTSQFVNSSNAIDEYTTLQSRPEPLPDWVNARRTWKWAWEIHVYGLGGFFIFVSLSALLVMLRLNRRICVQPLLILVNVFIIFFGLIKSVYLFIDAYHSTGSLPDTLVHLLHGLTFPIIIGTYSFLQMFISGLLKIKLSPSSSQGQARTMSFSARTLYIVLFVYFLIVAIIYPISVQNRKFRYWMILTQGIFITWGFVLCFMFIHNSFVAARYARETGKALKQIVTYCRLKREMKMNGLNRMNLDLHRIDKTRFDYVGGEFLQHSIGDDTNGSDSSNSLIFYNEAASELRTNTFKEEARQTNTELTNRNPKKINKRAKNSHIERKWSGLKTQKQFVSNTSSLFANADSGDERDSESVWSVEQDSRTPVPANDQPHQRNGHFSIISSAKPGIFEGGTTWFPVLDNVNNNCCLGNSDPLVYLELLQCHPHARTNRAYLRDSDTASESLTMPTTDLITTPTTDRPIILSDGFTDTKDIGYLADTESPKQTELSAHRRRFKLTCHLRSTNRRPVEHKDAESPSSPPPAKFLINGPAPDECNKNCLGLNRIRQGRVVRKILKITYLTTGSEFIMCVAQVYALFGVFGVFSNVPVAAPWPWLIFQTISRYVAPNHIVNVRFIYLFIYSHHCRYNITNDKKN